VPLSLVGTFAALYMLGYSLDNLSLMALTIAVGFVVDDAVVVIENVHRHLEAGLSPLQAALKGAGEIGFTIVSITFSLIAVFIPLFLMSGYVGLLFREFAVTVSVALVLSFLIALTLTPMMCCRLLKAEAEHGRLYRLSEAGFEALLHLYERGLKHVLRHRFVTLLVMLGTVVLTGYLYVVIPKGFFPQQDTGMIIAISQAADKISFQAMEQKMEAAIAIILKDPAVRSVGSQIGANGTLTLNDGRMFIALKPKSERTASADQVIRRLGTKLAGIDGLSVYMQAAQDITIGARVSRTQYQYTLVDADAGELAHWAPIFLGKLEHLPEITDVASDQENAGPMLDVTVNRDVASSYGILPATIDNTLSDAFGQRIVSTMFHDAQPVPRHPRGRAAIPAEPAGAEQHLHPLRDRPGGAARNASEARRPRGAAYRQSPGPVSCGDIDLQSEARGFSRPSGQCHPASRAAASKARLLGDELPGQCQCVSRFSVEHADPDRGGAHRGLHHPGCAL
jgi:multidrug efflux pump subunit AcrB